MKNNLISISTVNTVTPITLPAAANKMKRVKIMKYKFALILMLLSMKVFAISVNPDGTGEVIVVPYFTAQNDLNTYVTISNTTDAIKAVKVKFIDGKHQIPMMGFNLYLSPWETFAFAVAPAPSSLPGIVGQPSGAIFFNDTTCVPGISTGDQFHPRPSLLPGIHLNTTEGMISILEMGEIHDGPTSCDEFVALWDDETWNVEDATQYVSPPTGGLSSSAAIIDVANGFQFSYEPTAFIDFYPDSETDVYHTLPTSFYPGFINADSISDGYEYESGVEAFSSVISKSNVFNQFNTEASIAAETEWVLNFPTKPSYECYKSFYADIYDRKGNGLQIVDADENALIAPQTPSTELNFCSAINVLKFGNDSERSILGSAYETEFNNNFQVIPDTDLIHGQMNLNFAHEDDLERFYLQAVSTEGATAGQEVKIYGVPVLGFAIQKYYNANAQPGLLAAYGSAYQHTYKDKLVESAQ